MIFVTVGEQLPFDRLIQAIDTWPGVSEHRVFAQIGKAPYQPKNIEFKNFITQQEFIEKVKESDLIISHAGMGTILTALQFGKKIIVMPRRSSLGEHRNDHQIHSVIKFGKLALVDIAYDKHQLFEKLNNIKNINKNKIPICTTNKNNELILFIMNYVKMI